MVSIQSMRSPHASIIVAVQMPFEIKNITSDAPPVTKAAPAGKA
jgi:hypothetical protein